MYCGGYVIPVSRHSALKAYEEEQLKVHAFIISARDGRGLLYSPATFQSGGGAPGFRCVIYWQSAGRICQHTYIEMQITEKSVYFIYFLFYLHPL